MFVVDNATVRAVDAATIEAGTPGLTLMERAGTGATRILLRALGEKPGCVLVLCGKGNNGGDGYVVARQMHLAGLEVLVAQMGDIRSDDARAMRDLALERGVEVHPLDELDPGADLGRLHAGHPGAWLVDALFGNGFRPPVEGAAASVLSAVNAIGRQVAALDCPSGLDGDKGEIDARCPRAQLTLTFGLPKWGLFLAPGRSRCGRVELVDLGFDPDLVRAVVERQGNAARYVDASAARRSWPRRPVDAHKYRVGSVLVVGASEGMSGAVALACNAAHRAGAGLVEAVVPRAQQPAIDVQCVESLVRGVAQSDGGGLSPAVIEALLQSAESRDAVVIGPGAGPDEDTAELLLEFISRLERPMVVDADGLNAASRLGQAHRFGAPAVLTPHTGELARLLDRTAVEIETDRRSVVSEAAVKLGAVVVHKGAPTFVADTDGSLAVIGSGGPALATAGSGDVLSGIVGALLAAGLNGFDAACLGAWVHGEAGDRAAREWGTAGTCARDLLLEVARVGRDLEGNRT